MEPADLYAVDFETRKNFTPDEISTYKNIFKGYDSNKNGLIEKSELNKMLVDLGLRQLAQEEITHAISAVHLKKDNYMEFNELLEFFKNLKLSEKGGEVKKAVDRKGQEFTQISTGGQSYHSFSDEEKFVFVKYINEVLKDDVHLKDVLPIDPNTDNLFHVTANGVLLCKLINCAVPGSIDERAINVKKDINTFKIRENLNLAISAAKSIGCTIISINPQAIIEKKEHLVLGMIWQILKIQILGNINIREIPELVRLLQEGEELTDLLKLPPEQVIIRWINYHLAKSQSQKRVQNLGADLKDLEAYSFLLNRIDKTQCDLSSLDEKDLVKRSEKVVANSEKVGAKCFIRPTDLLKGNPKIGLIFAASIFNANHGIEPLSKEEYEKTKLLDDDIEGTIEERSLRFWINSLGIEDVYVNNLYEDSKDGLMLLKVIDKLQPGLVNPKTIEKNPSSRIKKISNGNLVVKHAKDMKLVVINMGGADIVDGNKKTILGLVSQLMKFHYLQIVGGKTEADLIKWANESAKKSSIASFKDPVLKSGRFLIDLCAAVEPRAVDWDIVQEGGNKEESANNAKYAISLARKLGATIFNVWEDIVKPNPKATMIFVASMLVAERELGKDKGEEVKQDLE